MTVNSEPDTERDSDVSGFLTTLKRTRANVAQSQLVADVERVRAGFSSARDEPGSAGSPPYPQFEGFEIVDVLGEGGFGTVYRARDLTLSREVAIKVLACHVPNGSAGRTDADQSYLQEARALASVNHENVIKIYSILEHQEGVALVMELVEGKTLEEIVLEQGTLGPSEVAQIGVVIARALAAVHGAGVVHRDVKPSNIIRARGGKYILTDFGQGFFLAKQLNQAGFLAGTPLYMSPEQIRGETVDVRSDIYSLGVTLYCLATGEAPTAIQDDTDLIELFRRITSGESIPLRDRRPDYPERLVDVIERAIATDADDRFDSAGAMERAICSAQWRPTSFARVHRRVLLKWAALAAAGCGLATGALLMYLSAVPFTATFWRIDADEPTPIDPGSELTVGEQFYIEFYSRRQVYAYVLMRSGSTVEEIFPDLDSGLVNPVPEDVSRRLPAAAGKAWKVKDVGSGTTEFYLIASLQPFLRLERALDEPKGITLNRKSVEAAPIENHEDRHGSVDDEIPRLLAELDELPNRIEFIEDCWFERFSFRVREASPVGTRGRDADGAAVDRPER